MSTVKPGKLTAIGILKWNGDNTPIFLGIAADVSNFGCVRPRTGRAACDRLPLSPSPSFLLYSRSYFQRGSVKEGLNFLARTIVQRTQPGQRQSVKTEGYFCHVHVRDHGLAAIVVGDQVSAGN